MKNDQRNTRHTALHISPEEFRKLGHDLVDAIAAYYEKLAAGPVTRGSVPSEVRRALGGADLPDEGTNPKDIFRDLVPVLMEHSLFTPHPRFWGYITGSAAPAGALSDLLASALNPNVGAWQLSPVASEIELQAVRWLAQFIGYPESCGGVLVSGGNMANFVGFLAARTAKAGWDVRQTGIRAGDKQLTAYVSQETHTWIHKAADLFGLGTNSIRWIPADKDQRMDVQALADKVRQDRSEGYQPFMVVGAGGTVSTGAVDPLHDIATVCEKENLWFHVDGAYGAPAAASPKAPDDLRGLRKADSVALDPHKWLYVPMEAGCSLVKDPAHLLAAFSFRPEYYRFEGTDGEVRTNLFEYGMQNSRGFRALKVWVQLKQAGRKGMQEAIEQDMDLSVLMAEVLQKEPAFEVWTQQLSIVTFRYVPDDLRRDAVAHQRYLNDLNEAVLARVQKEGVLFVSNAVIRGSFVLRACIVNYRTTEEDVRLLPGVVLKAAKECDQEMRKGI